MVSAHSQHGKMESYEIRKAKCEWSGTIWKRRLRSNANAQASGALTPGRRAGRMMAL